MPLWTGTTVILVTIGDKLSTVAPGTLPPALSRPSPLLWTLTAECSQYRSVATGLPIAQAPTTGTLGFACLILTVAPGGKYYAHFTEEEMKDQGS